MDRRRVLRYAFLALVVSTLLWIALQLLSKMKYRSIVTVDETTSIQHRERFNLVLPALVSSVQDGSVKCVPLNTAKMFPICIDTKDKFIGPSITSSGSWEAHIWNVMARFLREDSELNLIDIGANIGVFTLNAASLGRKVVAVEAFYENIQRMSESLRLGGLTDKVTIVYNAVSDVYEDVYFWRPDDNPGGTHTLSKGVTLAPNKPVFKGDHNKVKTVFMDDLVRIIPFKKAILKIDIEGYENKAFKKAAVLLDKIDIKALFMEWSFITTSKECVDIVNMMNSRGYSAFSLELKPLTGNTQELVAKWPHDIVWIKKTQFASSEQAVRGDGVVHFNIVNPANVPPLEDGTVQCVPLKTTTGGKQICIDKKDKFIGPAIIGGGSWEPHIWSAMLRFLNKDSELNLIDIGANIGVFTLNAASLGRKVIAVEAFYENIQRMSESLRLGGLTDKVTIVYNAVSDVYEDVYFWRPVDNPGGTHTLSKGVTLAPNRPVFKGDHNKVKTIFMNDLARIIPFKKAILKIDIEGYENKAFKQASVLLDSMDISAVFMEWTFVTKSEDCLNIVEIMTKRGYVAHSLKDQPLSGNTRELVSKWPIDIIWIKK